MATDTDLGVHKPQEPPLQRHSIFTVLSHTSGQPYLVLLPAPPADLTPQPYTMPENTRN